MRVVCHAVEIKKPFDRDRFYTCISQALASPEELHPLLITAATHYRMKSHDVKTFTPLLLLHINLCIQSVNAWISTQSGSRLTCAKNILTLCISECCEGNIEKAETHLRGVVSVLEPLWFMDMQESNIVYDQRLQDQAESVLRYFMLTLACVGCLKGRSLLSATLKSTATTNPTRNLSLNPWQSLSFSQNSKASAERRVLEPEAPYTLTWLSLFPVFFSQISLSTPSNIARNFEASRLVHAVKSMTVMMDDASTHPLVSSSRSTVYEEIWNKGASANCFGACMRAHLETIEISNQPGAKPNDALISSWTGFMAALILYNMFVLGMHDLKHQPFDKRIHRFLLTAIVSDLRLQSPRKIRSNDSSSLLANALCLWKAVVGITSVNQSRAHSTYALQPDASGQSRITHDVHELSKWIRARATKWASQIVPEGTTLDQMLGYIAWPAQGQGIPLCTIVE